MGGPKLEWGNKNWGERATEITITKGGGRREEDSDMEKDMCVRQAGSNLEKI